MVEDKVKYVVASGATLTNDQAQDYAALAMVNLGFKRDDVYRLIQEMKTLMDMYTEDEASEKLRKLLRGRDS